MNQRRHSAKSRKHALKLRKKDKLILALVIVFCIFFVFEVHDVVLNNKEKRVRCDRPFSENIIIPVGETLSLPINLGEWDLQTLQKDIISINIDELIPIARGQTELIATRKDIENCSFSSTISVVNFQESTQSGNGRVGL